MDTAIRIARLKAATEVIGLKIEIRKSNDISHEKQKQMLEELYKVELILDNLL